TGVQCQIVNTFHFLDMDRQNIVAKAGGLHNFINFQKPIFTDSGGFQVFSLGKGAEYGLGKIQSIFPEEAGRKSKNKSFSNSQEHWNNNLKKLRGGLVKKISETGVNFLSPRDGREIMLTPELSAEVQMKLGADFIYLLDICGSAVDSHETTETELEKTHRWYQRFLRVKIPKAQSVFAIIQGGEFKDLRIKATQIVNDLPVFGLAIGGALGKDKKEMMKIISWVNEKIDWSRPHHLLGIGDLKSIPEIIKAGIDLFDCALPTRIARHGTAITKSGYLDIRKNALKNKFQPIDKNCRCFACENYTLAQLNFLFKANEPLGGRLLTIHNLSFLKNYLREIREKIANKQF
ncbi:MAG TPA: tRNA guanosine(34) transglycosylase Tgt, partial [Candidatus Paceibacterota bacterium]